MTEGKNIIRQYIVLSELAKKLFSKLRDIQVYGNTHWKASFAKTFDVFTRLWKFQQKHRDVLVQQLQLKRWQIGDIASRIGQLYYQYYMRTSNPVYLLEAHSFYSAIRLRKYYCHEEMKEHPELLERKLRFFGRLLVVTLLLHRLSQVADILREFQRDLSQFLDLVKPHNEESWRNTLDEVRHFFYSLHCVQLIPDEIEEARGVLNGRKDDRVNIETHTATSPNRTKGAVSRNSPPPVHSSFLSSSSTFAPRSCLVPLLTDTVSSDKTVSKKVHSLRLADCILVTNTYDQMRFNEISIDMFRMISTLETLEVADEYRPNLRTNLKDDNEENLMPPPSGLGIVLARSTPLTAPAMGRTSPNNSCMNMPTLETDSPPHKYLLDRPTFWKFLSHACDASQALPNNGVLLLYLSVDGEPFTALSRRTSLPSDGYSNGGLVMRQEDRDRNRDGDKDKVDSKIWLEGEGEASSKTQVITAHQQHLFRQSLYCLFSGDLRPLLRRPLFVIVESDYPAAFEDLPDLFHQPVLVLRRAELVPTTFSDCENGNLMTLFLYHPLEGLSVVCNVLQVSISVWTKLRRCLSKFYYELKRSLSRSEKLHVYIRLMLDDRFLRTLVSRFVFFRMILRLHKGFRGERFYPTSQPSMTACSEVWDSPALQQIVLRMAHLLRSSDAFVCPNDFSVRVISR